MVLLLILFFHDFSSDSHTQEETSFAELGQEEQRKRSREWAMLLAMAAMPTIDTALHGKSGTIYGNNIYDNLESQGTQDIYKGSTTSWKPPVDTVGGGKINIKFSEMTSDEAMKIAETYRTKAPIEIPETATMKPKSMNAGYEQITYKWNDVTYKYEVRWHTRTPGAPANQGNTWVIERRIPGNGGEPPKTEILSGNQWISRKQWQNAIEAYQNGTATAQQLEILEKGHWKE